MKHSLRFLDIKKVEIIQKTDARAHTASILNNISIRATFFRRKVKQYVKK